MFIRVKRAGKYQYLQLVENRREGKRTRQRIIATLGRLDRLCAKGQIDTLLRSLGRFAEQVEIQEAHANGELQVLSTKHIGPGLVFGRLWQQLKLDHIIREHLTRRKFQFDIERAIFATVLHRLFESGSDRQGMRFIRDVEIPGTDELDLHHLYRAMAWLGENKDVIEEDLFHLNRDLFTKVELVFFDTTSFYLQGEARPIFHRTYLAITGHLFCSFLALLLMHELTQRLNKRGWKLEWADILRDLRELEEVELLHHNKRYLLHTPLKGVCGKVLQGAGVAIPPPVRPIQEE